MSQTVNQLLSVTPEASDTPSITLDGDTADIEAGGNGIAANLRLADGAGQERVSFISQSGRMQLLSGSGELGAEMASNGNLTLGGTGGDGDLYLKDNTGTTRVELDGQNHRLLLRASDGGIVADMGPSGNLTLGGGGGLDGDLYLKDANGTTRLQMDAENQLLRIRNAANQEVGRLGDNANLTLGGHDSDGDVDLYDGSGQRRILLNADGNSLSLWDASGNQVGSLGPDSNLRLGGHGTDGDVLLYPSGANDIFDTSAASIHLDGNAGDITLRNADCAEEFEVLPCVRAEPGTVMALAEDGRLRPSSRAHERAVVGVVSGAGTYKPGIVLDRQRGRPHRRPIALMGKTWVKVTDEGGPIRIGDLLTTASTEGHAMRASDPMQAFGAVIGKAIAPHDSGEGVIPMVIALQ